jgi:hypothetical protein
MKNLQEYIEESLLDDIDESLLDDIDDLEKDVDSVVHDKFTLASNHYIRYVMVYGIKNVLANIDKSQIKKLSPKYTDKFHIYNQTGSIAKNPNIKYVDTLVRYIMELENIDGGLKGLQQVLEDFLTPIMKCKTLVNLIDGNLTDSSIIRIQLWNGFDEIEICMRKKK